MVTQSQLKFHRITTINDPYFRKMHNLMREVFPPEEVLEYSLWAEPLEDPGIQVYVAILSETDEVVGATEYRYYSGFNVAMTDFTIIGRPQLGIGRFLYKEREQDLKRMAEVSGQELLGMFAEIYDPYRKKDHEFGGVKPMDPYVRREVLSHLGYQRLDFSYVHPSWENNGEAVTGLDLGFMPMREGMTSLPASLVADFVDNYYAVLSAKPEAWLQMMEGLREKDEVALLPL
ncbi:GNAT family acetyltransferase [Paenibacillus swuensis]|uniref:GNAT family acetyltransferase n=1 Tax=Paenibacillus swuensis TaxID=1178515 RepID=A0A172TLN7_9BACL|nr:GNAT family acetyltransferase [Paenibacillus swuensis]ANE47824.1 GNAT family acetyltransferase [Paenibacillus swuensis]